MTRTRLAYAAVLACALAGASAGSRTLPLEDHEVFVVQTAQEMRERGDWVVPYFYGRPRLTKPPLSYWAVAAVASATGAARVQPWQGRLPSIAAAVGLAALTMLLAGLLVDRRTAVTAGLVAATSTGLFRYAHSARPDMLYAFWCSAMLVAFAWAARTDRPGPAPALAFWVAAALASLTKGPQVPAMYVAAAVAAGVLARWPARRLARALRPLWGLPLAVLLAAPWWWAVDRAVPGGLGGTQLAGSLLTLQWSHVLDPYFFYRPLALVLPSAAILAPALLWRRLPPWDDATRFLLVFVAVPAIAFSFGPQHRPHYMLPALAPLAVLLALCARAVGHAGARGRWALRALAAVWAVTVVLETTLAASPLLWSRERFAETALARRAGRAVPATTPLVSLASGGPAFSYYAGRVVPRLNAPRRVAGLVAAAPNRTIGLFAPARLVRRLPPDLEATVLDRADTEDDLLLLRVVAAGAGARPDRGASGA